MSILNFPASPTVGQAYTATSSLTYVFDGVKWVGQYRLPPGATGPTGSGGATGAQGNVGASGANGLDGATGLAGTNGRDGINGSTGATGPQGQRGASGANGLDGATGPAGATGSQGIQGQDGATGATGIQGDMGATGAQGNDGATGATGDMGATGAQGIQGQDGATGATGIQGDMGATGAQGLTGATGAQGLQGAHGATGPQGIQGATGLRGADGSTGARGNIGATGVTGAQGVSVTLQGTKATIADLPLTGNPGDGWIVTTGDGGSHLNGSLWFWNIADQVWNDIGKIVGPQGDAGPTGDVGASGIDGATGFQGATGATGPQGNVGATGANGTPGSLWSSSTGLAPAPGTNPGDQYLDADTGNVYQWDGETWILSGNIKGPQGDSGSGSSGTVWTNSANGCLRAELSATGFQAFTDATHLDLQDSGQWNIGSYQNSTFIGNDEFTNTNILSLRSGDDTYITTNLRENGNHQWRFGTDGTLTAPGSIVPNADIAYDLGSPDKQWRHIYVNTGSIYLGGIKLSTENNQLSVQQVTNIGGQETVVQNYALKNADRLVKDGQTLVLTTTTDGAAVIGVENTATDLIIGRIDHGLGIQSDGTTVLSSGYDTSSPLVLVGGVGDSEGQDGGDIVILGGYSNSGQLGSVYIEGQYAEILTLDGIVIGNGDNAPWFFDNSDQGLEFPDATKQYTAYQGSTIVSDTAPDNHLGRIWFNSTDGRAYVKYNDLWVDLNPQVIPSPDTYLEGLTIEDTTIAKTTFNDSKSISIDNEGKTVELKTTGELQVPGDLVPETTSVQKLGTTTKRWAEAHIDEIHTVIDGGGASTWLTAV